jgi:hypothetical protein
MVDWCPQQGERVRAVGLRWDAIPVGVQKAAKAECHVRRVAALADHNLGRFGHHKSSAPSWRRIAAPVGARESRREDAPPRHARAFSPRWCWAAPTPIVLGTTLPLNCSVSSPHCGKLPRQMARNHPVLSGLGDDLVRGRSARLPRPQRTTCGSNADAGRDSDRSGSLTIRFLTGLFAGFPSQIAPVFRRSTAKKRHDDFQGIDDACKLLKNWLLRLDSNQQPSG